MVRKTITKSKLMEIVREEILNVTSDKPSELSDREKKKRAKKKNAERRFSNFVKWGDEEAHLKQLAHGIAEENPYRDPKGHFTDEEGATCVSTYFKDGRRRRVGGRLSNRKETGRGESPIGHGRYRCKDNKKLWEEDDDEQYIRIHRDSLDDYIRDEVYRVIQDKGIGEPGSSVVIESDNRKNLQSVCRKAGFRTFKEFLAHINSVERAKAGELNKDPNK